MQHNNIILLDEFEYYKARKDPSSLRFINDSLLQPILMTGDVGKSIIKRSHLDNLISGSLLVTSQVCPSKYFDIHSPNLVQDLRDEYFEILLKYAPFFGASEVIITYEANESSEAVRSNEKKSNYAGEASKYFTSGKASYSDHSAQDNSNNQKSAYTHTKSQLTNSKLRKSKKEDIIRIFEQDGIAYDSIPLLSRMLSLFGGSEVIEEKIFIGKTIQSSERLLKQIDSAISAKHDLFSAQCDANYMSETKQSLQSFQSSKFGISIKFDQKSKGLISRLLGN